MQHFLHQRYSVQGALDFGRSSRVYGRGLGSATRVAMLPPSGSRWLGEIYTAEK